MNTAKAQHMRELLSPNGHRVTGKPTRQEIETISIPRSLVDDPEDLAIYATFDEWTRRLLASMPNPENPRAQLESCFDGRDIAALRSALQMLTFLIDVDYLCYASQAPNEPEVRAALNNGVEGIVTALLLIRDVDALKRQRILVSRAEAVDMVEGGSVDG